MWSDINILEELGMSIIEVSILKIRGNSLQQNIAVRSSDCSVTSQTTKILIFTAIKKSGLFEVLSIFKAGRQKDLSS
jgi:curli biogenesis system outer membrane secretion channel CsgG